MRIGLLFDGPTIPPKDGVSYRVYNLAKQLGEISDMEVVCFFGDRGWATSKDLSLAGLDFRLFPFQWLYGNDLSKVAGIIKDERINVLHICNSHSVNLIFGKRLANILEIPLIIDMHDVDEELLRSLRKSNRQLKEARLFQQVAANCADAVICISSYDYQLLKNMDIGIDKLYFSPNGIDVSTNTLVNSGKNKDCIFLGNMYYEPNYNAALSIIKKIAPRVLKKYPDARFVFIGRTPMNMFDFASPNFIFPGEVDDLSRYMQGAAMGLAPLFEGSGMKVKLLTYAQFRLPVIATKIASQGFENIKNIVQVENIKSFTESICSILDNPISFIATGASYQSEISKEFSWSNIANNLRKIYVSVSQRKVDVEIPIRKSGIEVSPKVLKVFKAPTPLWLTEKRFN